MTDNTPTLHTPADIAKELATLHYDSLAPGTRKLYAQALRRFNEWMKDLGISLPAQSDPNHVASAATTIYRYIQHFLAEQKENGAPYSINYIRSHLRALSSQYETAIKLGAVPNNPVKISRASQLISLAAKKRSQRGKRIEHPKAAFTKKLLTKLLETCNEDIYNRDEKNVVLRGYRDRAWILFAFAAGGRRASEIAAARFEELEPVDDGYTFTVVRSKTDKLGEGLIVPVMGIAAEAMREWLIKSEIIEGPLFVGIDPWGNFSPTPLGRRQLWNIIRERVIRAGLDPKKYSTHSLRAGFITEGVLQGHILRELMMLSGHKSEDVARKYVRPVEAINSKVAKLLG